MIDEEINKENEIELEEEIAKPNFDEIPGQEVVAEDDKKKKDGKKPLWRKILDWTITGVFGAAALVAIALLVKSKVNPDGMVLGRLYPQVLTDSMADKYPVGTVLVVKGVDPSEIQVGDAVTFRWIVDGSEMNMTHEVFKIEHDETKVDANGNKLPEYYTFYAHGTNTHSDNCGYYNGSHEWVYGDCTDISIPSNVQKFTDKKLVGKVERTSPILGITYKVVQSPIGLIVLILLPCLYLMVTSVIDMFKKIPEDEEEDTGGVTVKKVKRADGSDPLAGMSDEEKERLKKQMLDELLGKKGGK